MTALDLEMEALRRMDVAAHAFAAKWKPKKGAYSPGYAKALNAFVQAAREFAQRSDESWAAEVAELRDALRVAHGGACDCDLCAPEGMR